MSSVKVRYLRLLRKQGRYSRKFETCIDKLSQTTVTQISDQHKVAKTSRFVVFPQSFHEVQEALLNSVDPRLSDVFPPRWEAHVSMHRGDCWLHMHEVGAGDRVLASGLVASTTLVSAIRDTTSPSRALEYIPTLPRVHN